MGHRDGLGLALRLEELDLELLEDREADARLLPERVCLRLAP